MSHGQKAVMTNEKFFDNTAENYDAMINFETALVRRSSLLKSFIKPEMKNAADLGCGTGLDTISLAMNGLSVTGFDISKNMIAQARKNAKTHNVKSRFHKSSADKVPASFNNKFDFITSLGNTLANLNEKQLARAIKRIYKMLKPGGSLLIQILNYDLLLKNRERIINISHSNDQHTIRFYDFMKDYLNFSILKYTGSNPKEHDLITTKIYPHKLADFKKHLRNAGFNKIKTHGNFQMEFFDKRSSKDLIIYASKLTANS